MSTLKLSKKFLIKKPTRRPAIQRLKERLNYKRNRLKILRQKKRYVRHHADTLKRRKKVRPHASYWRRINKRPTVHHFKF